MASRAIPQWAKLHRELAGWMDRWLDRAVPANRCIPYQGVHDEGTFTVPWFSYWLLTGRDDVLDGARFLCDSFRAWVRQSERFHHGYGKDEEIHHCIEMFLYFVSRLLYLEEPYAPAVELLDDVAHHVGNWVAGIPAWYEYERRRFRSTWLGTEVVRDYPPYDFETLDHMRFIAVLLHAYQATGRSEYLELSVGYLEKWCDVYDHCPDEPPVVLFPTDDPHVLRTQYGRDRRRVERTSFRDDANRYVSGGIVEPLIDAYRLTGNRRFLNQAGRLLELLVEAAFDCETDPQNWDYGTIANLLVKYWRFSGACFGRETVVAFVQRHWSEQQGKVGFVLSPRRMAVVRHLESGAVRPEPLTPEVLMTAYHLTGELAYALRACATAVDMMRTGLCFADSRWHGCSGATIHSVAWRTLGPCLYLPAFGAFGYNTGGIPWFEVLYQMSDRRLCLPRNVCVLSHRAEPDRLRFRYCLLDDTLAEFELTGLARLPLLPEAGVRQEPWHVRLEPARPEHELVHVLSA